MQDIAAFNSLIFIMKILVTLLGILTIIDCTFLILRINRFRTKHKITRYMEVTDGRFRH